jgi:tetratricopeptide (TPR) repeat protein
VHLALGDLYRAAGVLGKSCMELDFALNLRKDLPSLHVSKGKARRDLGLITEAEAAFKQAVTVNSVYWESHLELANFYYSQQRYDDSINAFQEVLDLEPKFADALIGMGSAYYMKKNVSLAETLWLRAEGSVRNENNGSLALIFTNRGLSYYFWEDFDNAIMVQAIAIDLVPDDHRFHGRLAECYRGADDEIRERNACIDAIRLGKEAIMIHPSDWESLELISLYHANMNEPKPAKEYQKMHSLFTSVILNRSYFL